MVGGPIHATSPYRPGERPTNVKFGHPGAGQLPRSARETQKRHGFIRKDKIMTEPGFASLHSTLNFLLEDHGVIDFDESGKNGQLMEW